VAAGDGHINMDETPIDHMAFTDDWLTRNGILAGSCFLISVKGDSMGPRITDGDLVLIDKRKRDIVNGKVYAFNDDENGARIKRLEVIPDTAITLISDNPEFAKEHRTGMEMNLVADNIIGQVVWSGHNWN
jgi:phage repressor protein C with HTH and peptisase S24 domain